MWSLGVFLESINVDDFKIFSLVQPSTLLFGHKLTVCCIQAGPGTCLHFTPQGSFLTKHIAKINGLPYSLPPISSQAVSCQEKEHPLVYFYSAWAQWYMIPIDALGIPIKNPRTLERLSHLRVPKLFNLFLQGIRPFTSIKSGHNTPSEI